MAYSYARRNQLSQQRGFASYGHERAAKEEAKKLAAYGPETQQRALDVAKEFTTAGERRTNMKLWAKGMKAFQAGDLVTARRIAAQLPPSARVAPAVPESVFWYH